MSTLERAKIVDSCFSLCHLYNTKKTVWSYHFDTSYRCRQFYIVYIQSQCDLRMHGYKKNIEQISSSMM